MNAINKRRRNQETPKKEEAQPMTEKQETKPETTKKRNAPIRVETKETIRGVEVPITMFEIEVEGEKKLFGTFAEATEALKAAKLASKKWTAEKVVAKMLDRLNGFELDKQYPKELQEDMSIILEAQVQFLEKLKAFKKGGEDNVDAS